MGSAIVCSHHPGYMKGPALSLQGNLLLTGDKDQLVMLLDQINSTFVRSNPSVLQGLLRIIPYLSFGEVEKMQILVERFKPYCNFDKYVAGWESPQKPSPSVLWGSCRIIQISQTFLCALSVF